MPDHFYVYPAYLGRGRSRDGGRRVPTELAVADLTAEEIVQAAQHLGFDAALEAGKEYPRAVELYQGRVKVTKQPGTTKATFLRALAAELVRRHGAGGKR